MHKQEKVFVNPCDIYSFWFYSNEILKCIRNVLMSCTSFLSYLQLTCEFCSHELQLWDCCTELFYEKGVLKISQNSQENTCYFIKSKTPTQVFPSEFGKIFNNAYFVEHCERLTNSGLFSFQESSKRLNQVQSSLTRYVLVCHLTQNNTPHWCHISK